MSTNVDNYTTSFDESLGNAYDPDAGLWLAVYDEMHADELCGLVWASTGRYVAEDDMTAMMDLLAEHELVDRDGTDPSPHYQTDWFDERDHMNILDEYGLGRK